MIDGEKELWRAIILQAMRDISDRTISARERRKARNWFCTPPPFFFVVCDMADVDPCKVIKKALEIIEMKKMKTKMTE